MVTEKLTQINHRLTQLIERFPRFVDRAILRERDRLCAYFDVDFFNKRSPQHILRLLLSMHMQRKKLAGSYPLSAQSRSVECRIIPGQLQFPFASKKVLGILVQITLSNRYELFDEENFQKSVRRLLPNLHMVKGTLYRCHVNNDTTKTWYAEFEKPGNHVFSTEEISLLKKSLGEELLERTEKLVPPVFIIRNQEEALRNILTLSQEIEQVSDLPQVMISFETQSSEEITFTVICVRAEDPFSISLENLIKRSDSTQRWILERKQLVRYLRDHQPIVAYLFRVLLIPHSSLARIDGSLNFFAARQKVGALLKESVGAYRDFNGGILIKQEETLLGLRQAFSHLSSEHIENIFYSITPIEMQAILPASALQAMIDLTTQTSHLSLNDAHDYHLVSSSKPPFMLIVLRVPFGALYEKAKDYLQPVDFPEEIQASFSLTTKNSHLFGYLIPQEQKKFYERFIDALSKLLSFWAEEVKQLKILRLNLNNTINSLDPRIGGDGISAIFLKMLFEGLTRIGPDGKLQLALAHQVEVSEDRKTYLFHLRPSLWSNGDPVTSLDFEYSWKKVLSPDFKANHTYLFFCIKNAEQAKKGLVPMEEVGIHSINDHLLKVELSSPIPHLLGLLALPFFSPVHHVNDINTPNWPVEEGRRFISNGAFKIEKNYIDGGLVLIKNNFYWEKDAIELDRVIIMQSQHLQSQEMFANNQIHWIGAPLDMLTSRLKPGPMDAIVTFQDNGLLWAICQTEHPLLKNKKIRKALSFAVDREALLKNIDYPGEPAFSPIPPVHSQVTQNHYPFSPEKAMLLWKEGLLEEGISEHNLPYIEISFRGSGFFGKPTAEFLCLSWQKILRANCRICSYDVKDLFNKFATKNFDVGLIRWQPWVDDPFYTLNPFANNKSSFNINHRLNPALIELIQSAQSEKDDVQRSLFVKQIEEILIEEVPIIPLYKTFFQSMRKKSLELQPNHPLMDFKWARLES